MLGCAAVEKLEAQRSTEGRLELPITIAASSVTTKDS
jgi:hypothetical protein